MLENNLLKSKNEIELPKSTNEDAEFWRHHLINLQSSGLSRRAYCLEHGLIYHRFSYWHRKFIDEQSTNADSAFLPVQITSSQPNSSVLCTLELGNQKGRLLIHNEGVLKLLLTYLS